MATCKICSKPIPENALTCPSCQATLPPPPLPPIVYRPPSSFGSSVLRVGGAFFFLGGLLTAAIGRQKPIETIFTLVATFVIAAALVTLGNVWDHARATWGKVSQIERELTRRK